MIKPDESKEISHELKGHDSQVGYIIRYLCDQSDTV